MEMKKFLAAFNRNQYTSWQDCGVVPDVAVFKLLQQLAPVEGDLIKRIVGLEGGECLELELATDIRALAEKADYGLVVILCAAGIRPEKGHLRKMLVFDPDPNPSEKSGR